MYIWSSDERADNFPPHPAISLGRAKGAILSAASYICSSEYLLIYANQPMMLIDVQQGAS